MMEATFAQIDTNRNNKLEESEVRNFEIALHNQTRPGQPFDEDAFQDHFDHLDKNEDGTVSRAELLLSMMEKARKDGLLQ